MRQTTDEQRVAVKEPAQLDAGAAGDFLLAAARQEAAREPGDRCIPFRVRGGKPRLAPNSRRQAAGHEGRHQQD